MAAAVPPLADDELEQVEPPVHDPPGGELPPLPDEWETRRERYRREDLELGEPDTVGSRPADVRFHLHPELVDSFDREVRLRSTVDGAELTPHYQFPPEGRSAYFDTSYPWRCVVDVLVNGARVGDGVTVGPRHVLTSSHILDWSGSAAISIRNDPLPGFSLGSAAATVAAAYTPITGENEDSTADEDYAVLVLDQRVGDRWGWLGTRPYHSEWDDSVTAWRNISHDPGFGTVTVFQRSFRLDARAFDFGDGTEIWSDTMDANQGMSGSPIFGFWADGPYAVSVHLGGVRDLFGTKYNASSGGSLMVDLVRGVQAQFP